MGAVQQQHARAEIVFRRLEQQVVVVRHEAVTVTKPAVAKDGLLELVEELHAVDIVNEELLIEVPARVHVMEAHAASVGRECRRLPLKCATRLLRNLVAEVREATGERRVCVRARRCARGRRKTATRLRSNLVAEGRPRQSILNAACLICVYSSIE